MRASWIRLGTDNIMHAVGARVTVSRFGHSALQTFQGQRACLLYATGPRTLLEAVSFQCSGIGRVL